MQKHLKRESKKNCHAEGRIKILVAAQTWYDRVGEKWNFSAQKIFTVKQIKA